jgi:hypothetical protein
MRWREGGQEAVMMVPGTVYEITASLWNTSYVIAPGHSLRLAVTSSNDPRFSVNYNNGYPLANPDPGPMITANNVLYHSAQYPSRFTLPVVEMGQLPKLDDIKGQFNRAFPDLNADDILRGNAQHKTNHIFCVTIL